MCMCMCECANVCHIHVHAPTQLQDANAVPIVMATHLSYSTLQPATTSCINQHFHGFNSYNQDACNVKKWKAGQIQSAKLLYVHTSLYAWSSIIFCNTVLPLPADWNRQLKLTWKLSIVHYKHRAASGHFFPTIVPTLSGNDNNVQGHQVKLGKIITI